jgi:hypothetical protein
MVDENREERVIYDYQSAGAGIADVRDADPEETQGEVAEEREENTGVTIKLYKGIERQPFMILSDWEIDSVAHMWSELEKYQKENLGYRGLCAEVSPGIEPGGMTHRYFPPEHLRVN